MALDTTNRFQASAQLMRDLSFAGLLKADVRAALNAIDDWADANAASFNSALPQPFRGTASTAQKNLLLAYVCMRRAGVLRSEGD